MSHSRQLGAAVVVAAPAVTPVLAGLPAPQQAGTDNPPPSPMVLPNTQAPGAMGEQPIWREPRDSTTDTNAKPIRTSGESRAVLNSANKRVGDQLNISYSIVTARIRTYAASVEVSFSFELHGLHSPAKHREVRCPGCRRLLRRLFEVAEVLRAACSDAARRQRETVRYAPWFGGGGRASVRIDIQCRRPFSEAGNGWALCLLEHVSEALDSIGGHEVRAAGNRSQAPSCEPEWVTSPQVSQDGATPAILCGNEA